VKTREVGVEHCPFLNKQASDVLVEQCLDTRLQAFFDQGFVPVF